MTKQDSTCATCSAQTKPGNKYCSVVCYRVAQRAGKYAGLKPIKESRIHQCRNCGKDVIGVSKSKKRNGDPTDHVYCNRDCYDAFRAALRNAVIGKCKHCDKPLTRANTNKANPVFCSWDCRNASMRVEPKHCLGCGCFFSPVQHRKSNGTYIGKSEGKTCSDECFRRTIRENEERKKKISNAFTGEKHPNWQGGAPIKNRGYRGSGWQKLRERIIKRDKYRCVKCGIGRKEHKEKYKCDFNVNHIKPFWQFEGDNQKANKTSNLETLCKSCHTKSDWEYRKNNAMQQVLSFDD